MAARDDGSRRTEAAPRPTVAGSERETWLCRSTIGTGSDGEDDGRWSELSAADDGDEDEGGGLRDSTAEATSAEVCGVLPAAPTPVNVKMPKDHKQQSRGRRLTLGGHLDVARGHALRKAMPPLATPVNIPAKTTERSHAKKKSQDHMHLSAKLANMETPLSRDSASMNMKKKRKEHADDHLTIYMDYEREPGFGKTPKPPRHREVFVVRRTWCVHVTLFLSTACVHCISFNASPGLRRLFGIDALPVGLCIVFAWTILGLVNCAGACLSGFMDRVTLLRRLAWLWIVAMVVLQLTKLLPLPALAANMLLACGYSAAVVAHGLLLPNLIALGAEIVTNDATREAPSVNKFRPRRAPRGSVDAAMSSFITWAFAAMLLSSSLTQAFYFAAVDLELPAGQDVLILRSRRAVLITLPCGVSLLTLLITFLFQSRHHASAEQLAAEVEKTTIETPKDTVQPRNPLERKLARGELEALTQNPSSCSQPTRLGWRDWLRLGRHSAALLALAFFTLLLLLAVASALVAHAVTPSPSSTASSLSPSSSMLVHLVIFAVLFVGWLMTMLLSASQLSPAPRDKLYAALDDAYVDSEPLLPSRQQLFVAVALICLASAAAFAAFVRAQLYSTMFVQTCQLRRPNNSASVLFDPNVLGAFVGLVSVLLLPSLHFLLRTKKTTFQPPRMSAARRVTLGVLLYLSAIFFSSIVELYRRDTRLRSVDIVNPAASHCAKTQPSSFAVLWSVPHLVVLALADALFRVGAAEEAYTLTAPLDWLGVSQAVLSLADSIGYAIALVLSKTLSSWLYRVQTSDLVLLLLMITALASLAYALTRRLADHIHASRRCQQLRQEEDDQGQDDDTPLANEEDHEDDMKMKMKMKARVQATAAQDADELTIKAVRAADRDGTSVKVVCVPGSSSAR